MCLGRFIASVSLVVALVFIDTKHFDYYIYSGHHQWYKVTKCNAHVYTHVYTYTHQKWALITMKHHTSAY